MTTDDKSSDQTNSLSGIEELLKLLVQVDPITLGTQALDGTRRLADEIFAAIAAFTTTMDNLNATATRLNVFMDRVQEQYLDDD